MWLGQKYPKPGKKNKPWQQTEQVLMEVGLEGTYDQ